MKWLAILSHVCKYSPYQPRDFHGRWTAEGAYASPHAYPEGEPEWKQRKAEVAKDLAQLKAMGLNTRITDSDWMDATRGTVTPSEFLQAMVGPKDMTRDNLSTVDLDIGPWYDEDTGEGRHGIKFHSDMGTLYGAQHEGYSRQFDLNAGVADHSYLELAHNAQGGGAVKKLFAEAIPLYQKMGISKIKVHAALSMGPYVWAKYGFRRNSAEEGAAMLTGAAESLRYAAQDYYNGKFTYSEEAKAEINRAADFLMAYRSKASNPGRSKDSAAMLEAAPYVIANLKLPKADMERRAARGDRHSVVSNMMVTHFDWYGHLNLKNKTDVNRAMRYATGVTPAQALRHRPHQFELFGPGGR